MPRLRSPGSRQFDPVRPTLPGEPLMPFWVLALIGVGGFVLVKLLEKVPGAQIGSGISLDKVENDQKVTLSNVHGPTNLGLSMPDPGHVILWTLIIDGQSYYANGGPEGPYDPGDTQSAWTGTDLWIPLAQTSGTVIVDIAWPSSLGAAVLALLGPSLILGVESAQQLDAQGLLHKTRYTITYGS
jgi:hypothetical protein